VREALYRAAGEDRERGREQKFRLDYAQDDTNQRVWNLPWPANPQGVNVAWCIDDFTEANGATRIVPGSHRLNRKPTADEAAKDSVALEAPAGSIIVMESRVWHETGNNRTEAQRRAGIFAWYTRPIYRQQENWFLSLNPAVRQFASDDMVVLLGYRTEGLGLVNGKSPA
jgi:ectoine hydroxylase-related dioxygenase (phytanoyl-CoA dioxygenase family)